MDPRDYLPQLECALRFLSKTMPAHHEALIVNGFLGTQPSQSAAYALFFETGCLHLYLMEHELRRGRSDDPVINAFWFETADQLLEPYRGIAEEPLLRSMLGWRLGRYEDVTAAIESSDAYGDDVMARRDDYFSALAQQFVSCYVADASTPEEHGLFLGRVEDLPLDAGLPVQQMMNLVQGVKQSIYEYALPVYLAAQTWAQDTPFYEKSVDELNRGISQAAQTAVSILQHHLNISTDVYRHSRWAQMYDDGTRFSLSGEPASAGDLYAPFIQQEEDGHPYLWLRVDENGELLRKILLLAHDLGTGINLLDTPRDANTEPLPLPLSLGAVDALLRRGTIGLREQGDEPDLSDPGRLTVTAPDMWDVGGSARVALHQIYLSLQEAAARENKKQEESREGIFSRFGKRRKSRPEPAEGAPAPPPVYISRVTDQDGVSALLVAPMMSDALLSHVTWFFAPGARVYGERQPDIARHTLDDPHLSNQNAQAEELHGPTDDALAIVRNPDARFERTHTFIYGLSGEPYEVIRATDEGMPLLDFALPCYDSGRGLALRTDDGCLSWWLSFGELIELIWNGTLPTPDGTPDPAADAGGMKQSAFSLTQAAHLPDRLILPTVAAQNIGWVLGRAGVTAPRMGLVPTTDDKTVLCLGPAPASPEFAEWARWRIYWYLPPTIRSFAFVTQPDLTPYPLQ